MNDDEISIRRFSWLLEQRGYAFVGERSLEYVLNVRETRPDFFVDTSRGVRFLAEVKSFQPRNRPTATMFVASTQRRVNAGPVEKAAQQLARYRNDGLPLVIVLDNHRQAFVHLGTTELIEIFGSLQYEMTIDAESGRQIDGGWAHSREDYALGDRRRPWVSAVVVNVPEVRFDDDDFAVPRPMRVHLIHNPEAIHPLPLWVFSEPNDKQIIRHGDRWIEFMCPPAEITHRQIQQRAFVIFEARGSASGTAEDDWLEAERRARNAIGG